ncbi:MAG TPA: AsmA-like C-terminal region-containing protein [Calidithermus sp.]|nr:AsmA-like C-terminal region-containing protein [Calidithermus sp.]
MPRLRTWLVIVVAAVVVLVAAVLAAVPLLVDTPRIQALIATQASQALGRPVKFANVRVSVLPLPSVVLDDLEVAEDPAFGRGAFLRLDEAVVRLRLWPLLLFRIELGDFILKRPIVSLVQAPDGRWNIATLGATTGDRPAARPRGGGGGPGAAAVLGSRVRIEDGVLTYETRAGGTTTRYRIEDLDLTLTGGAAAPVAFQGGALVKPGDLRVKIDKGTVALNGARGLGEAPVRAEVRLEGSQIRDLVAMAMGPEPSVAGALRAVLAVTGTVGKPRAGGDVELSDLTVSQTNPGCPEPRRRTLALGTVKMNVAWEDGRLTGRPVTAALAGGSVTTNLTAALAGGPRVELGDLAVKGVPVEKVLVDYLCQGYAVSGPLELAGRLSVRLDDLWRTLDGAGRLRIGPGQVVGPQALAMLGSLARVGGSVSALLSGEVPRLGASPLDFDAITATYTITDGVVSTRDFLLDGRALRIRAAGTYALASGAMNLDVVVAAGRTELKGKVTGTAAAPSVRVAPPASLREVEPGAVQRELQELLKRFR